MQFAKAFQYKKWANNELLDLGEKAVFKTSRK